MAINNQVVANCPVPLTDNCTNKSKPIEITPRIFYQQTSKLHQQLKDDCKQTRKLVILMTWLGAEEKHIKKYGEFYLDRGFDVVNVRTTSIDILLPKIYTKRNSRDCINFLVEQNYDRVFYHGFSVGAVMYAQLISEIFNQEPSIRDKLSQSIRGIVIDSAVVWEDFQDGLAKSFTNNAYLASVIRYMIMFYKVAARDIATNHYMELEQFFLSGPLKRPSMFVYSKADPMIDHRNAEKLADSWIKAGIELDKFVVENAGHVQVFRMHNDEYKTRIENLLKRVEMM